MTTTSATTESVRPVTIRADKVSKHYGEFAALQEVSFAVQQGTVAAFLGPNGAGKSTTMRILTGYLAPTSGRVEVLGLDPTRADERIELARKLGYLPENGPVYHDMTPLESLRFFGEVCKLGKDLEPAIERVVDICALGSVLQKPIHKLSKGFRQRVGMARALLHDPEVIIMDEPTSGLDPLQIREVRRLIRELGKDKTILLSTHILQEVEAMADEVIVISDGRIVFTGSKDELLASAASSAGDTDAGEGKSALEQRFYQLTRTKEEAA